MSKSLTEAERQAELSKARLEIAVLEARDLKAADFGGTSDPFVELRIKDTSFAVKTSIKKKTLNPFWNESFTLYPTNLDTDILLIKIYDYDSSSRNDLIGQLEIHVALFVNRPPIEEWKQVMDPKNVKKQGKGEIKLRIAYIPPGQSKPATAQQTPQTFPGQQPPQGYPPQGYPPQGYPPQGFPPQGYPPQGFPPQGYPPQGYPVPQGYPPQGYPPQGYPPQGYPPQGYPPGGVIPPPQGYPPQGYPPQGYPGFPPQQGGYPPRGY